MRNPNLPATPFPLAWPSSSPRTADRDRRRSAFGSDHAGDVSLATAHAFVSAELGRMGIARDAFVITSNVPQTRADAAADVEHDPGIAVWFVFGGETRVLACDRWQTHAENLRAIGLSIEAMRALERWGVGDVLERAMVGFLPALPAGDAAATALARVAPAQDILRTTSRAVASHTAAMPARPAAARDSDRTVSTTPARVAPARDNDPRSTPPAPSSWRTVLLAQELGDDIAAIRRSYHKLMRIVHPDASGYTAHAARLNAAYKAAKTELGAA